MHAGPVDAQRRAKSEQDGIVASRRDEIAAHAREVAQGLVGLSIAAVRKRVAADATVTLREIAPNQPVTLDYRPNRITVTVVDGTVVETSPG